MTGFVEGGGPISTDSAAFDAFFRATYRRMRAQALLLAWDPSEAEDAVQDAYLELWRSWSRVSGYESPEAWVYKIMMQRLSKARRNWFRRQQLEIVPPAAASVDETVQARLTIDGLSRLGERQRQVIVGYCLRGKTQREIAEDLGIRRATVAVHLRNARIKLARSVGLDLTDVGGGDALLSVPIDDAAPRRTLYGSDPVAILVRHVEAWLSDATWGTDPDEDDLLADLHTRAAAEDNGP